MKPSSGKLAFLAAFAAFASGCQAGQEPAGVSEVGPWPGFGGPHMTGVSGAQDLADRWGPDGPKRLWSVPMRRGWSGPAVVDGRVYILDAQMGQTESLRCLDLATGKAIWSDTWANPRKDRWRGSRTVPRVDAERIYVLGHNGELRCYARSDGKLLWNHDIHKEFPRRPRGPAWGHTCDPILHENLVIVAPLSFRVGLVAYDQKTGKQVWTSGPAGINSFSNHQPRRMHLAGRDQIVLMANQYIGKNPPAVITGVDADDGKILWQSLTPGACNVPIPPAVPVGDDKLLLTAGYRMGTLLLQIVPAEKADPTKDPAAAGLEARVGLVHHYFRPKRQTAMKVQLLWQKPAPNCHMQMPILYKGLLWANSFDKFHQTKNLGLACVEPTTGKIRWASGPETTFANGPLVIADDKIYIVDSIGGELSLVAADGKEFRILDRADIFEGRPREVWAPLAIAEGKLLVRNHHELICLDIAAP